MADSPFPNQHSSHSFTFLLILFVYLFILMYLALPVLGLRCCARAFPAAVARAASPVPMLRPLIAVASLLPSTGSRAAWASVAAACVGAVAVTLLGCRAQAQQLWGTDLDA